MRARVIVLATLLALTAVTFVPTSSAVGWCVDNAPKPLQDCSYYLFCFGRSSGNGVERCQIAVDYPCRYCMP